MATVLQTRTGNRASRSSESLEPAINQSMLHSTATQTFTPAAAVAAVTATYAHVRPAYRFLSSYGRSCVHGDFQWRCVGQNFRRNCHVRLARLTGWHERISYRLIVHRSYGLACSWSSCCSTSISRLAFYDVLIAEPVDPHTPDDCWWWVKHWCPFAGDGWIHLKHGHACRYLQYSCPE